MNPLSFSLSSSYHLMMFTVGLIVSLLMSEVYSASIGSKNILDDGTSMLNEPGGGETPSSPIDRMDAEQFVRLFDRLMDGEISRIMEQIKSNGANINKIELIPANKLSARQFIKILDFYSSGAVSSRLRSLFSEPRFGGRWIPSRSRRMAGFDSMNGVSIGYSKRTFDPMNGVSLGASSPSKRAINVNFDEIDRAGFSGFAKRRAADFDELDHSGFSNFAKRFDEMDHSGFTGFAKRSADFDEIDRSGFHGFLKRRLPSANFDELDHSGFSNFVKRLNNFDELDRAGFSSFAKRTNNFDEMDRTGFITGAFAKRMNFDELDHSGFNGFNHHGYGKRSLASLLESRQNTEKINNSPMATSTPMVTGSSPSSSSGDKN